MELVYVAGITSLSALITAVVLNLLTNRARQRERSEDFARQDAVAKEVKAVKAATEAAAKLLLANTSDTNTRLAVIHTLVNSQMTAALQSERDATERLLVVMLEIIELKKTTGHSPNTETLTAVEVIRNRVKELQVILTERGIQTAIAAEQGKV